MIKYYIAKARFIRDCYFCFTYTSEHGEFPNLGHLPNPADYNIYEITEEEYKNLPGKKKYDF